MRDVLLVIALSLLLAVSPLDDAAAALAAGDAEACGTRAQEALASGQLDVPELARAWTLRGRCFTLVGDLDRAERSYAVALRVDAALDATSLASDAAFAAAKHALPSTPGLSARAAAVDDDTIELELLGDDLLLVKAARLQSSDGVEVAHVPLDVGQAHHKVSGVGREGLSAVLLDKAGNALQRLTIDPQLQHVKSPAPAPTGPPGQRPRAIPTMLTTIGATAIGTGIVGVVACGIGLAASQPNAEGAVWVVGVGASTGMFLLGAGLVLVDQGL